MNTIAISLRIAINKYQFSVIVTIIIVVFVPVAIAIGARVPSVTSLVHSTSHQK